MRDTQAITAIFLFGTITLCAQQPAQAPVNGPILAEAKKMLAAAEAFATKSGTALSCVVVDARGALIAMERMDNAIYFTPDIARAKALSSAAFGAPSGNLAQLGSTGVGAVVPGTLLFVQGAMPLVRNNQRFGAIGCSGGTGQQDEDGAKAGAAAFGS